MTIKISYNSYHVHPKHGETVLESLERVGCALPSSCRVGVCHFCIMKAVEGPVPKSSQEGLSPELVNSRHFKSCVCIPENSMVCEAAHTSSFRDNVTIESLQSLSEDIVAVSLAYPENFVFKSGQFVTIKIPDGPARSYSIASPYHKDRMSFDIHVRLIPGGKVSTWFHEEAKPGDQVWLEGPKGDCTYRADNIDEDLLLVGTGTGMAPLYGVALEALASNHKGSIRIIQGALSQKRLYLVKELMEWERARDSFYYQSCVLEEAVNQNITVGDLTTVALEAATILNKPRIYLCGDPGLVRQLKKHFFLQGTSLKKIHADPFIGTEAKASVRK